MADSKQDSDDSPSAGEEDTPLPDRPIEPGVWPTQPDAGTDAMGIGGDVDAGGDKTNPPPVVDEACAQNAQRWSEIAQANCVACHGRHSPGRGGFFSVLDVPELIASGKVVPSNPDGSPLFVKISSGAMPPAARTQRPSPADIDAVRAWIACGAPAPTRPPCLGNCTTFVDIATRLDLIRRDLEALATPEERADTRYLDLSNFANAGHSEERLELHRDALSFLLNSLSTNATIAVPQSIDPQNLVFRIRLSAYNWSAATWERIAAEYPYAVTYDPNSRSFPVDEAPAQRLRDLTGTDTPYIQADWFFTHAARPPLYHDILGLPGTMAQLEAALGIDIADNIAAQRVIRAGFKDSGPSRYNRVIERHSLAAQGALWLTYDFAQGAGTSNVLIHPLDFQHDSSEAMFHLPNGLQAYMIVDQQGVRVDKAPNDAVQDPMSRDGALENGLSCINCHAEQGILEKGDEIRASALLVAANSASIDSILQVYVDEPTRNALFAEDRNRYVAARAATRVRRFLNGSAYTLDKIHLGLLGLRDVAGALGIEGTALSAEIAATPRLFPPEFIALQAVGASVPRDQFDAVFGNLVVALTLGQPR